MKACCEFSRKIQINQIQKKPLTIKIDAEEDEKIALAKRFFIPKIHSLSCMYKLKYFHGGQIRAVGEMKSTVTQNCVISLEDFSSSIDEVFELLFIPIDKVKAELEEIDDPDVIPYSNDVIDLGEITAEQLALFLDPYPHKKGAENPLITINNDHLMEDETIKKENPFQILEKLKNIQNKQKK